MPKLYDPDAELTDEESILEALREFKAGFRRNGKNNLSCRYEGKVLTVFLRGDGYAWCIHNGSKPRYSETNFSDEDEALGSLAFTLMFCQ